MRARLLLAIGFLLIISTGYSKADNFKTFEAETKGIKIEINTKLELFHIMAYLTIMDDYNEKIAQIPFKYSTADPSNITFLCESFLRSLTAYFLIQNQYNEFAQMVIQGEKQQGYIYNDIIVDLIKEYSGNRNKYKSFNDYVPELLNKLRRQIK